MGSRDNLVLLVLVEVILEIVERMGVYKGGSSWLHFFQTLANASPLSLSIWRLSSPSISTRLLSP